MPGPMPLPAPAPLPGQAQLPAPAPFPGPLPTGKDFNDDMFSGGVGGALGSGGLRPGDSRSGLPLGNGFENRGTYHLSRLVGKPTMWFPNRSDTNQAVQLQKQARSLKFCS